MTEQPPQQPPHEEPAELLPFESLSHSQKAIAAIHCYGMPIPIGVVIDEAGLHDINDQELDEIKRALEPYIQYGKRPDGSMVEVAPMDSNYLTIPKDQPPELVDQPLYYYKPVSAYADSEREQTQALQGGVIGSQEVLKKKAEEWKAALKLLGIDSESVAKHHFDYMEEQSKRIFEEFGLDF